MKTATRETRKTDFRSSSTLALSCFAIVILVFCVLFFTSSPKASPAKFDDISLISTSTPEGRLAVFDDVWETIQERYYDPTFHGVDWQAKRLAFRPAAAKAHGSQEFYEVLRQMVAALEDAHTRVYSPDNKFDWWKPRFITVGLTIREVEGLPIVIQIGPNSPADRTGIRPGDQIISVDNQAFEEFILRRLRNSGLPSDGAARSRSIATLAEGPAGIPLKLAWQTRDGKIKSAIFPRYWSQRHLGFRSQNSGKFAVVKIEAFTQTLSLEISKALPGFIKGSEGIVLDLRANGGGDAEAMADVTSLFLDDGINLGRFADRNGASFELQTFSKRLWPFAASPIKLPLVVLTSENTSSAAEIMAAALQKRGRARVIGSVTCGCVLAIRNRHALPDGGVLDVSEFDYRTADGVRLEGLGVKPDRITTLKRRDIYSRRDEALELALDLLKKNHKNSEE